MARSISWSGDFALCIRNGEQWTKGVTDRFSKEIVYLCLTFYYVLNYDCFTYEVISVVLLMLMFVYIRSRER